MQKGWKNTYIHPWRLTWNIIMEVWKIIFLSKWVICMFHVNLPGCKQQEQEMHESHTTPQWTRIFITDLQTLSLQSYHETVKGSKTWSTLIVFCMASKSLHAVYVPPVSGTWHRDPSSWARGMTDWWSSRSQQPAKWVSPAPPLKSVYLCLYTCTTYSTWIASEIILGESFQIIVG